MNFLCKLTLLSLLITSFIAVSFSEELTPTNKFKPLILSMKLSGLEETPWVKKSFKWSFIKNLSEIDRIEVKDLNQFLKSKCPLSKNSCLYQGLEEKGVDALFLGKVTSSSISYKILDSKRRTITRKGSFDISKGATLANLKISLFKAFKPYLEKGGYLDQKNFKLKELNVEEDRSLTSLLVFFIFLLVCSLSPWVILFFQPSLKESFNYLKFKKVSLSFSFFTGVLLTAALYIWWRNFSLPSLTLIEQIMGGIFWGILIFSSAQFIFPSLARIEMIQTQLIIPFFRSWTFIAFSKIVLFSFFALPLFYFFKYLGNLLSLGESRTLFIFIPFSYIFLWIQLNLFLECFSLKLDTEKLKLSSENHALWQEALKKYFIGYLKRGSLEFNRNLIDQVQILIGSGQEECFSYGSSLCSTRIFIHEEFLKSSMKNDPHEKKDKLHFLHKDSAFGKMRTSFIVRQKKSLSDKSKNILSKVNLRKSRQSYLESLGSDELEVNKNDFFYLKERENLMMGQITPKFSSYSDESISLVSDDQEDLKIVEELMSEHRKKLDKPSEDLEVDDTNPMDRDYLFGVLLREFGVVLRQDYVLNTILLLFKSFREKFQIPWKSEFFQLPTVLIHYHRVSDSFCVFFNGLEHLYQFYFFKLFKRKRMLTKRASKIEFQKSFMLMKEHLESFEGENPEHRKSFLSQRFSWLERMSSYYKEKDSFKDILEKRFNIISWILAAFFLVFIISCIDSYAYQSKYNAIVQKEKVKIEKLKKDIEKKKRKNGKKK